MTLVYFIGAIAFLIFIHELGHFAAARLLNVEVEEFGIGFPPRMLRVFRWGGTDYTLNWLPLGGFVRLRGMDNPDDPEGFAATPPLTRIAVLIAGPLMNILAGIIIYAIIFMQLGQPISDQVIIVEVAENSPAAAANLQADDLILSVNETQITDTNLLFDTIYANLDQEIELVYQRDGQEFNTTLVPRSQPPEGQGAIGIVMGNPTVPISFPRATVFGAGAVYQHVRLFATLPGQLLAGSMEPEQGRLLGYKGMYDVFENMREIDQERPYQFSIGLNTLNFMASITISLALLNLFPLPALDGGRILFALPELIFGKRVPAAYENMINLVGFSLLIMLLIYINIQDFVNPINIPR